MSVIGRLSAAGYLTDLVAGGRFHFATPEAVAALGRSTIAVRAALRRLKAKGELADPVRGFHVIVPPEYRRLGCLPAEQFISQLMEHLGEFYYVALLSAAELHGAAHHRPQSLQVMLQINRRPIVCGEVRVQFVARHDVEKTPVVEKRTPRGVLRVASVEATVLELVGYADQCGGLDHVASVIAELAEAIEPQKLLDAARASPIVWAQRLGYLLDLADRRDIANALALLVEQLAHGQAPLVRALPRVGSELSTRWKLAINTTVHPDL